MWAWLLVLAASTGCAQQTASFDVVDTSGAPFRWTCGAHCIPEATEGTPPLAQCQPNTRPLYAWSIGRFVMISSACAYSDGSWTSAANLERPLSCDATDDCPQFGGGHGSFTCRGHVCQNADVDRFPPDYVDWTIAEVLCYAPIPREDTLDFLGDVQQRISDTTTSACHGTVGPCDPLPDTCLQL